MTSRTWFNGSGSFINANDWTPSGVPVPGDTITFGEDKMEVQNQNLIDIPMVIGS